MPLVSAVIKVTDCLDAKHVQEECEALAKALAECDERLATEQLVGGRSRIVDSHIVCEDAEDGWKGRVNVTYEYDEG